MKCLRCNRKELIFDVGEIKLYQCTRCETKWSRLYNQDEHAWKYIEGNYLVPDDLVMIIFSGTQQEFVEAKDKIVKVTGLSEARIARLSVETLHQFKHMPHPVVYVTGTYYIHDDLLQDEFVMKLLNGNK